MADIGTNIFFVKIRNGRGTSLVTVPRQMKTSRTPLRDNFMTHGCESLRRKFPEGTVFACPRGCLRERKGCYAVDVLVPVMLPDGSPASATLFAGELVGEYRKLTSER